MTKDLTQGSPVRLILGFALPLLAGMLFQQLYNLVDTLIVGRFLGMEALAGVGATGSTFWCLASAWASVPASRFRWRSSSARGKKAACANLSPTERGFPSCSRW
mgnify:CR=1 FL=1